MTSTTPTAMAAVLQSLQAQAVTDAQLIVSEPDADGRVQIEGTVDLQQLVTAALAADTLAAIDGPLIPSIGDVGLLLAGRPAGEIVRLIVTGSVPADLPADAAPEIAQNFHETAAKQVEKALSAFWGLIDWKAAPVEPLT